MIYMIHNIRYRLFVYNNENQDELIDALHLILPEVVPELEEAEGMLGENDNILIYSGIVDKKRYLKDFLSNLIDELDKSQLLKLYDDVERKMDEQCNLFLRFSKESAINEKWEIIDGGDSIHLKIKVAAYPAKKDIAVKNFKEFLSDKIENKV